MDHKEKAMKFYEDGSNCSQAILMAFSEDYQFDQAIAERLAVTFGSGMSGEGKTCGCLSGALMVLGLEYGTDSMTVRENRREAYHAGKSFIKEFEAANSASDCKELLALKSQMQENNEAGVQKNVSRHRCKELVGDTAERLSLFLKQNREIQQTM